jgi:hypothetical protein
VVFTPSNVVTQGQFSVNGQRTSSNYFTIDGVSANFGLGPSQSIYERGGGGVPSLSVHGGTNTLVSVDAVQEFAIQTSAFAPEFGRQPGAQVSIVTRSGTNDLRGSAFYYFRHDALDANNFFANASGLPKPKLRQNDFGVVLGGPLRLSRLYDGRNQTFFFVSYEGLRLRQPTISPIMAVPSLAARERATGIVKEMLNAYPLPTGPADPNRPDQATFVGGWSDPSSVNATSVRLDHRVGEKLNVFGRFNHAPSEIEVRAAFAAASSTSRRPLLTQTWTLGGTLILSSRAVNDLRVNYSKARAPSIYFLDDFGGAVVPSVASRYPSFASPTTDIFNLNGGTATETLSDGLFQDNRQRQLNVVNSLSLAFGAHSLKIGVDYRRLTPIIQLGAFFRNLVFGNLTELATGVARAASVIASDGEIRPIYNNYSAFVQDAWRLNPRLTLTYGLRYEINPCASERDGRMPATIFGLDNLATATLAPPDTRFYETTYGNLAPRLGFSYQVSRTRETVVRGGFGKFYDLGYHFLGSAFGPSLFPYGRRSDFTSLPLGSPLLSAQPPPPSTNPPYARVFAYEANYRLPYTLQYSLGVEQPLGAAGTLSLSYVGARGRRLPRLESLRNATPSFQRIDLVTNQGFSNYNALQAQFRRRLSRGLQALVSYTYGKSLDTVSEEGITNLQAASSRYDVRRDYGPSTFDVRHAVNAALSYDLPSLFRSGPGHALLRDFALDASLGYRTATPVNVLTAQDPLGLGLTNVSRPDLVPGVPLYIEDPALPGGRRFNPAAFDAATPAAERRQGTFGRNVMRGFPFFQLDLGLRRGIAINQRLHLQARVDAFNVLNRANFANPNGTLTSPSFGRATQMLNTGLAGLTAIYQNGGPRSLQLSMKLNF